MKKIALFIMAHGIAANLLAQLGPPVAPSAVSRGGGQKSEKSDYKVVERGPHHTLWERIEFVPAPDGRIIEQRRSYQELATGMHFKNERGEWEESKEEIEILPNDAGAIAAKGQHKVIFPVEIKSGLIEMQTPDGKWLRSRVWGLAYFDAASGESVLLAEVKESDGQVVGDNVVVYPDAFTDFRADIRYTYMRSGFEQDVVLRENPPAPEEFGLSSKSTRLQVLTEFVEATTPIESSREAGGLPDQTLEFGAMTIGIGKAFSVDAEGATGKEIPVAKQWEKIEGRSFLIEEVLYQKVDEKLKKLPPASEYRGAALQRRGRGDGVLAGLQNFFPRRYAKSEPTRVEKTGRMAKASYNPGSSFVLDYISLNASLTNYIFQGDTTYYVSGAVNAYDTTTFEGGAVIKFGTNGTAALYVHGPVICDTEPYRPLLLTSKDDNTIGATISDSTGNPVRPSYALRLWLYSNGSVELKNMRMMFGSLVAINTALTVFDSQIIHGSYGLAVVNGSLVVRNVLMQDVSMAFFADDTPVSVEHLTLNRCAYFYGYENTAMAFGLTNSLLVGAEGFESALSYVPLSTNANVVLASNAPVFQVVGGGAHYLAQNSPYRNVGTTNINANLLGKLKQKTTYAPLYLTNTIATDVVLGKQADRDVEIPDLGYHYDPIDYFVSCQVTNATVTLSNGAVIGYYDTVGFHLNNDARLVSEGLPKEHNQFVYYTLVQEQAVRLNQSSPGSSLPFNPWHSDMGRHPEVLLNFTTLRTVQGAYYLIYAGGNWELKRLIVKNCELYGPNAGVQGYSADTNITYQFINNLFELPSVYFYSWFGVGPTFEMRNNLFVRASVTLYDETEPIWVAKDNAFDGGDTFIYGDISHNAYLNGCDVWSDTQSSDIFATNLLWASGPLGNYYLPTNSPLINRGSTTADQRGLFHFTTQVDEIKEATTRVDIGYHYVATACNPIDTVWVEDGIPAGASTSGIVDTWSWISSAPPPYSAASNHISAIYSGIHQHYFAGATTTMAVNTGDKLVTYVYLDPVNTPSEVMLQWRVGSSWEHRAYWGADNIAWGTSGTASRRYMGALPSVGQWVRLEVPASDVGLEGVTVNGAAYTLYGGRAAWDYSGKSGGIFCFDSDDDGIPDYLEDINGNGIYGAGDLANWTSADTDGDGVNDGLEILQGRNPLVAGSTPDSSGLLRLETYTPLNK
jgi:hypothetical protein